MSTTATTLLPSGTYYIVVAGGGFESLRLTDGESHVTILPPSVGNDPKQEWVIENGENGITISRVSPIFPFPYLSYRGAPGEKPKAGDRIVVHVSDFPPNKWRVRALPGFKFLIQVADSDLGIAIAPPQIHPPFLDLKVEGQLEWRFERVLRPE